MAEVWTPPALNAISTTDLVTAAQLNAFGNSLRYMMEVAYVEFTADVTSTATSVGTANQIVSAGSKTYEAVPHMIEFFCANVNPGANTPFVILRDSTTVLGTMGNFFATGQGVPCFLTRRVTPTAAAHTYNIAAWNAAAATATYNAGTGGTAGDATSHLPGYIRIWRIPT